MIEKKTIERIIENADIVSVVGETVRLQKSGSYQKGCCPFHGERTPSFVVYPQTNTFKCYGCGKQGNIIGYVMERDRLTFPEAVKALGKRCGVEVDEREETAEEQAQRMKQETLRIYNRQVAEFYRQQFLMSKEAQDYAYGRWGKEYCDRISIGYAPAGGQALGSLPLKEEWLQELGLLNKYGYDFFQNRITINICDRFGEIIGFTARCMDDSKPKYLNSIDSDIYHKSQSVFGIDTAWRTACKTDTMYLVEGGPDCMRMHSIEVFNTVACLGSEWTKDHFSLIRRAARRLCFIPDDDPPKKGERFGHGIENVFKAGRMAIEMGFSVSVKEIPDADHTHKQDPDTYFTDINIFNATEESDFILWYAEKHFPTATTTEDKSGIVKEVAKLLSLIDDTTKVNLYIDSLTKFHPGKLFWKKAIETERKKAEEDAAKEREQKETDIHKQFGFYVEYGKYYSLTEKGSVYEWSNFTMRPLFHIKDVIMSKRLYLIKNEDKNEEIIELKQEDLVSLQKFRLKVEGLGNFIWKATEKELTKLKGYLYSQTETATLITQLGWQRQRFYAFGNGVLNDGQWIPVDDYGIVRLGDKGNYYLPAFSKIYRGEQKMYDFERRFAHLNLSAVSLHDFSSQFFKVFGDNGRVGFAFLLATLFRDIVTSTTSTGWFPILNLFGPKGTGKSDMGNTLMRFFVQKYKAPNIRNATVPALNDTVASAANAVVMLDEYKNSIDIKTIEFLKGLWDGTGRTRMNMDLDKRKETTAVDAGVILAGQEMPTMDIALFSRLIFLRFPQNIFTDEQKEEFRRLERMRDIGLTHLTVEILKLRGKMESAFATQFQQTCIDLAEALKGQPVEDRIMNNWAVPLAVYRCLETSLDIDMPYAKLFDITINGIVTQNAECKTTSELGGFWSTIQYLVAQGDVIEGGDYRIKYVTFFKSTTVSGIQYQQQHPILYLQKTRIFKLYLESGKRAGYTVIPEESLKYYLEKSPAFLGEKFIRYKVYAKGIIQYDKNRPIGENGFHEAESVQRSYCFDYQKLVDTFDINLERANDEIRDDDERYDDEIRKREEEDMPF